ncbi:MAG: hypothetical protein OXU48_04110 [candidate division Zixibacteria bacterium]|nr:hypothetical protein [candidate division Zixibacteria bacterium]
MFAWITLWPDRARTARWTRFATFSLRTGNTWFALDARFALGPRDPLRT